MSTETTNKNEIPNEDEVFNKLNALTLDISTTEYSVEWQRVGNMQQSAGTLMTALAIITAAVFAYTSFQMEEIQLIAHPTYSLWIIPGLIVSLVFVIITFIYLFKVIYPSKIFVVPHPLKLQKQLWKRVQENCIVKENAEVGTKEDIQKIEPLGFITYEMIRLFDQSIKDVHVLVEEKQKNYYRGLLSCGAAVIIIFILYIFVIFNLAPFGALLIAYWIFLAVFTVVSIVFIFKKEIGNE